MTKDQQYIAAIDKIVDGYKYRAQVGISDADIHATFHGLVQELHSARMSIYGERLLPEMTVQLARHVQHILTKQFSVNDLDLTFDVEAGSERDVRVIVVSGGGLVKDVFMDEVRRTCQALANLGNMLTT